MMMRSRVNNVPIPQSQLHFTARDGMYSPPPLKFSVTEDDLTAEIGLTIQIFQWN